MIVKNEDLKTRHIELMKDAHSLGDELGLYFWNECARVFNQYMPLTGDDAASAMLTTLTHSISRLLIQIKHEILDKDDTGRTMQDSIDIVFEGVEAMLTTKRTPKAVIPSEIKRIK